MVSSAKNQIAHAIDSQIVDGESYNLVSLLADSAVDTAEAMGSEERRVALAQPVLKHVGNLSELEAQQIVDTATHNPGAIHAMSDEMSRPELLAMAAVFLEKGIKSLPDISPDAPTVLDQALGSHASRVAETPAGGSQHARGGVKSKPVKRDSWT